MSLLLGFFNNDLGRHWLSLLDLLMVDEALMENLYSIKVAVNDGLATG